MSAPKQVASEYVRRACSNCGKPLATDNNAAICGRCHRDTHDELSVPPVVAESFFDTDDFRAAFHSEHIGKCFRVYRHHPRHLRLYGKALTQETLGRWFGLNQAQVSKIEKGEPEYNLKTLRLYATTLHFPQNLLWFKLSPESQIPHSKRLAITPQGASTPAISELCASLVNYHILPVSARFRPFELPLTIDQLENDLAYVFDAYQKSKFTISTSRVTTLLSDVQENIPYFQGADKIRAFRVLALSYQAAASVLGKAGHPDIAWIAADRGMNVAKTTGDPAIVGSLARSVAFALLSGGRFEPAMSLIESGAAQLEKTLGDDGTRISVYGTLFLAGSMAAARFGDSSRTTDYLYEAEQAANRLGDDANHLWSAFGPTNVTIHRVNTALELDNINLVLKQSIDLKTAIIPAERKARYLLDIARAHNIAGNREEAISAIISAERIAPEQIRQHHLTKSLLESMMRGVIGRPPIELDKLIKRVHLFESGHE